MHTPIFFCLGNVLSDSERVWVLDGRSVYRWVCEVGEHVYECECECIREQVCGCVSVWAWVHTSVDEYVCECLWASVQVIMWDCGRVSKWEYQDVSMCVSLWMCACAWAWDCESVPMWVYEEVSMCVRLRLWECVCVSIWRGERVCMCACVWACVYACASVSVSAWI